MALRRGSISHLMPSSPLTKTVRIYVPEYVAQQAQNGQLPFYSKLTQVLVDAGFAIEYCPDDPDARDRGAKQAGYSISLMKDPVSAQGLVIRKTYFDPFWNIQTSAKRWEWPLAIADFEPNLVFSDEAANFANYWRKSLFGSAKLSTSSDGFVYVPLQGLLNRHRSFQNCSPIRMLKKILSYDKHREIRATLHPRERYSTPELESLQELAREHSRFTLSQQPMEALLRSCDYVATQNSSVALYGYFFHKPAVLFAQIDFHHIAANVMDLGAEQAVQTAPYMRPCYDAYLCWFFKHQSINVSLPNAEDKIAHALRSTGWPV